MSLAVLADHMASKGRGPDSMLIHMSPREVQGLQALAENHGGSLTINPETGLPEAGFLDKLLPTIIGVGLSMAGVPPHIAAMMVGGAETVRTGDLGKGISAGLGAYGGAGIGAGMTATGAEVIGSQAAGAGAGLTGDMAFNLADAGSSLSNALVGGETGILNSSVLSDEAIKGIQQQTAERVAAATPFDKLSAGFDAAKANPSSLLTKDNFKYLAAGAAPILADQAVTAKGPQTTTRPGMIRPYSYDPYGGTYTAGTPYEATPTKAAYGGLMGLAAGGIAGYGDGDDVPRQNGMAQGGMYDFAQRSEPVVRMARGGIAHFEGGGNTADNAGNSGEDRIASAYASGDYATAGQLIGNAGLSAQDVVNQYGLNQDQAADVAKNLGYAGDMSNIQYGAGYGTTVNDLYTNILGRSGEQAGVDYWQGLFGNTIDANELAQFNTAAQAEIAARNAGTGAGAGLAALDTGITGATTPAYTNQYTYANINDYIANNSLDAAGITAAAKMFNVDPAQITAAQNAQEIVSNVYRNTLGRDADPAGLDYWVNQIMDGKTTGQEMFRTFLDNAKANKEIIANPNIKVEDAVKAFGGYKSADARGIADEWVRNTLGREVTDADRKTQWYKDAVNDATNTYEKGKAVYGDFKTYAQQEAAATTSKAISDTKAALAARGLSEIDVIKQTGKTIAELVAGGTNLGLDIYQASQLKAPGAANKFDFSKIQGAKVVQPVVTPTGSYGNATNPGDITTNKDGTTTITPNIPYRPPGGFSGIGEVTDAYTKGGGSLGYVPYAPKTIEEFDEKYGSRLTGGSKAAMDYLTGKTPYDPTPYTKTGEIQKPYWESVGRFPENRKAKKYIFRNGKYEINPDFVEPSYVLAGKKAAALADPDNEPTIKAGEGKKWVWSDEAKKWEAKPIEAASNTTTTGQNDGGGGGGGEAAGGLMATGGLAALTMAGGGQFDLGGYSDGGRLLRGPGDGVSDSIPATIGNKRPARLADGEFVVPARIVSELGNGSTEAGARKLYAMMNRVQAARKNSIGKGKVAKNSRADKYLPA